VKQLPGGGKAYIYNLDGLRSVIRIPPRGFDPLKAPTAKLVQNGYPPRPSGGQALRSWITMVQNAHFIAPPKYLVSIRVPRIRLPRAAPDVTTVYNPIWAGNMATQCSTCKAYQDVYANWLEPSTNSTPCSPTARGVWAGLGGYHVGTLVQDGTSVGQVDGLGDHQAWYELIGGTTNDLDPVNLYATVGGEFTAEVDHVSGGYYIFLKNDYTGASYSNTVSFSYFNGSTAEAIVEDPNGGVGSGEYLRKFDSFEIEDAEASRDGITYHGLADFDHDDMIMDYNYSEMAHPGSAFNSGDSWYDYYDNCS
jgi:hypothetical protein